MLRRVEALFHTFSTLNCMTVGQLQASVGLSRQPLVILPTECMETVGKSVGTAAPCHWRTDRAVLRVPHVADSMARTYTLVSTKIHWPEIF